MKMEVIKWRWWWPLALVLITALLGCAEGGNVTYDGRSLIVNGEHKILFSGSIHYPRSTPEVLWLTTIIFTILFGVVSYKHVSTVKIQMIGMVAYYSCGIHHMYIFLMCCLSEKLNYLVLPGKPWSYLDHQEQLYCLKHASFIGRHW